MNISHAFSSSRQESSSRTETRTDRKGSVTFGGDSSPTSPTSPGGRSGLFGLVADRQSDPASPKSAFSRADTARTDFSVPDEVRAVTRTGTRHDADPDSETAMISAHDVTRIKKQVKD